MTHPRSGRACAPRPARSRVRWRARATVAVCLLGSLVGCSAATSPPVQVANQKVSGWQQALAGTSVGDVIRRPALRLLDTNSQLFDLQARPPGQVTLLFFGYTHCPDVCPTTMADLAAALRRLTSPERARVEVAFVTEDPSRDLPPQLRIWLDRFDHSFIGLVGGGDRTAAVLRALKAPASEVPRGGDVEHTGSVYAFAGSQVLVYTGGTTPAQYAADLRLLLRHTP